MRNRHIKLWKQLTSARSLVASAFAKLHWLQYANWQFDIFREGNQAKSFVYMVKVVKPIMG